MVGGSVPRAPGTDESTANGEMDQKLSRFIYFGLGDLRAIVNLLPSWTRLAVLEKYMWPIDRIRAAQVLNLLETQE